MKIYNTLSRRVEKLVPLNPPVVTIYSCGPTVYDYQHIGHMRRYVGDDILIRGLKLNGYEVKHAMNITDVGHLVSDSDVGEDKMEKGARKFGKSVWEIAKMFEQQFNDSCSALHIELPKDLMHATDYIKEQIALILELEKKGYTYSIDDGIYFDSSKFSDYAKLSGQDLEKLQAGARVEVVSGKKHATDFALWKFSPIGQKRQMEWESPWGVGFPGWHIECSAMAMKALGKTLDIHTGGIDHIPVHHTNEIAQSEAATGEKFVRYWVHHNFLQVEGQKMSKSLGNFYTVQDVVQKGYDPLALRYLYFQTHYRQEMNFTWESLDAAQKTLERLWKEASVFQAKSEKENHPSEPALDAYHAFTDALDDDLNMPKALAALHEGLAHKESDDDVVYLLSKSDVVLGLDFIQRGKSIEKRQTDKDIPEHILQLVEQRNSLRRQKKFHQADGIRVRIEKMGYHMLDEGGKTIVTKES